MEGEKIRILLIEDNPGDARLLRELLAAKDGASFDLEHEDRLSTALARLAQGDIDVILLDLSLPDSHGLDGLNKICAQAPKVPIVVLSGLSDEAVAIKAVQEGAQDYLVKGSVDSDSLVRSLHYAIERQHFRVALRESEARYRLLADNAADVIWTANMKWQITYISPSIKRLLGYTVEEMKRLALGDILTPDSLEQAGKLIRNQMDIMTPRSQYPSLSLTLEHLRKDGSTLWAEVMLSFLWDKDGKLFGIMGATRDITERKRMEEALRESEKHYSALVGSLTDAVFKIKGRVITWCNDKVDEIYGYTKDELIGKKPIFLFPVAVNPLEFIGGVITTIEERGSFHSSGRVKRKDGSMVDIEYSISQIPGRESAELVAVARDITERRQMEEALRESELLATATIEGMADGVMLVGMDGKVAYINKAFEKMLGYKIEELVGTSAVELPTYSGSKDKKKARQALKMVVEKGSAEPIDMIALSKDGMEIPINFTASVVKDAKGNPKTLVAVIRDVTERRKAEDELRRSEEYFRALMENSSDAVTIINEDGTIRYESPSYERLLGFKPEERVGSNLFERIHPDDITRVAELFAEFLPNRGGTLHTEVRAQHKEGPWRHIEAISQNLLGNPIVKGIVINLRDVTKRKKMEEELRLLSDAVRMTTDSVAITDMGGRILDINEAGLRMYGLGDRGDFIGRNPLDAIAPEDRRKAIENMAKIVETGQVNNIEYHVLRKDGSRILIETSVSVIRGGNGEPKGLVAVARNITERKKAEEALKQSEKRYRQLFESMQEGLWLIDKDSITTFVNPRMAEILGYTAEEMLGKHLFAFMDERGIEVAKYNLERRRQGIKEQHDFEFIRKDGARVYASLETSPITDEAGNYVGALACVADITERKRMEEEKQRMEEQLLLAGRLAAVGELSAGVAHELNNPIAAIQGFAQLLTGRNDLDETMKNDLGIIYREAQRAAKITQNLLSFARRHEPEKHPISINDVIENILEMQAHLMKVNNIELEVELDPDLPKTMADFHQMQQVFMNIVNNAEQAMLETHGKSRLLIKTQRSGKMVQITFADNGPGISEENLKRIFDPFFTTKEVGKGTGLGLSICYGLVAAHGGRIYARSKLGQGATVVVEMPIVSQNQLIAEAALLNPGSRGVKWNKPGE